MTTATPSTVSGALTFFELEPLEAVDAALDSASAEADDVEE